MTVTVRPLQSDAEARAAGALLQSAYFRLAGYPRDEHYDANLAAVAERASVSEVVVAVVGEQVVGCLTYVADHHDPEFEFDDEAASSFRYFAVEPSWQGRGVGTAMVQWCIARAQRDGKARVRIHTLESMAAAQRLYERLGFRRDHDNDEDWDGIKGIAYVFDCLPSS